MFEFFIALFGGAYYTNKFFGEKATSDMYERNRKAIRDYYLKRLFHWIEQVCDRALEEELARSIAEAQNNNWSGELGEEIWAEIRDAYLHMPTRKEFAERTPHLSAINSTIFLPKTKKQWDAHIKANAVECERYLNILLARRGKVRNASLDSKYILDTLCCGNDQFSKNTWNKIFEYWVYIRDELRRNGVNARLIFKMGMVGEEHTQIAYDVDDVEKFRYHAGQLTWLPLTYYDENLQYMRA